VGEGREEKKPRSLPRESRERVKCALGNNWQLTYKQGDDTRKREEGSRKMSEKKEGKIKKEKK